MRGMKPLTYRHTAYPSAWLAAAAGFGYSVFFVLSSSGGRAFFSGLAALFLLLGGILGASALLGLYERLRDSGGGYALWAFVFGLGASLAATLHGGFDLANSIHAPGVANPFPSQVDPRGLGTFGLSGVALLGFAFLILRDRSFPRGLGYLGYVSGALLVLIYLARLIILSASNPLVLGPAALEGFIVNPAWYLWLGFALRRP
jgi:hypothetical protein